tara:strand:- start:87 stop:344 length:258 start_codon:yes stop_codon:yes gene_type:complete
MGGSLRLAGGALGLAGSGSKMKKLKSFINKLERVNASMRRNKVLSRAGAMYAKTDFPYASQIGVAGETAGRLGYGRRRMTCRRRR